MKTNISFINALKNPPTDSYPGVMWFWNDKITETEIKRQILEYRDANIYEFFIHPMFGFQHLYLSEEFFELVGIAVSYAKELGMKFWIYDEYNWPSGNAGNIMMREHPWSKSSVLSYKRYNVKEKEEVLDELEGEIVDAYFSDEGGETVLLNDFKKEKNAFSWINENGCKGELLVLYRVYHNCLLPSATGAKYSTGERGYVDLMNGEAVDLFLKYTHEEYKKYFGAEFGKTIKGVFTDEPTYNFPVALVNGQVSYTDKFYETFRELKGYGARPKAWMMFTEADDVRTMNFKKDWHETLSYLFEKNYAEKYHKWCRENNLIFTGHINWEEDLLYQAYHNGSYYNFMRHFDRPGMDTILSRQHIDTERFNLAGYMISSVAKFAGKNRVLSETYTGSGWEFSMNDKKRIANRLLVEGVNFVQYMAAYYSMKGSRKTFSNSYPPSHNGLNPQFVYYKDFNQYLARFQYVSSESVPDGKTLILHPFVSCQCQTRPKYQHHGMLATDYYSPGDFIYKDATLAAIVNAMQTMNRSFQIGFEEVLHNATVQNGKLSLAGSEYEMIILPGVDYVKGHTARILEEFVMQGGKLVLANTSCVRNIDAGRSIVFRANMEARRQFEVQRAGNENSPRETYIYCDKNVTSLVTNETRLEHKEQFAARLSDIYDTYKIRELFRIEGDGIISSVRQGENMTYAFLMNDKVEETAATIYNDALEYMAVLDVHTMTLCGTAELGKALKVCFSACDGKLLLGGNKELVLDMIQNITPEQYICADEFSADSIELNPTVKMPYNLKRFAYRLARQDKSIELVAMNSDKLEGLLREHKEEYLIPLKEHAAYESMIDAGDGELYPVLTPGQTFVTYAEFCVHSVPKEIEFLCENLYQTKVIINGKMLTQMKNDKIFNVDDLHRDVSELLHQGMNTVILVGECSDWGKFHTIPFTVLKGSFRLVDEAIESVEDDILPCGDICQRGYPNFAGILNYEAIINGKEHSIIKVNANDPVEVTVNSKKVADLVYEPRVCDVSDYLDEGENRLVFTVRTKLKNIFSKPEEAGIVSVELQ